MMESSAKDKRAMAATSVRRSILQQAHENDESEKMTFSRIIAIFLARRFQWYNPKLLNKKQERQDDSNNDNDASSHIQESSISGSSSDKKEEEVNIEKAWWYYEHITLPRYLANSVNENRDKYDIAQPGEIEHDTKLYSPLTTTIDSMGDFGIGIGLYFATLKACTILLVLAGLLNIINLVFYASSEYSDGQKGVRWFLKGSAVCTNHQWVPCQDCLENNPFTRDEKIRLQTGTNENGDVMTFVLKNMCEGAVLKVGMINFATVFLIILGIILMAEYLNKKKEDFDLDEQTAQDYSISINNPPPDATDPQEWRNFFHDNFPECHGMHVTTCTVAVDNDDLLCYLVERRKVLQKLKDALPDMDIEVREDNVEVLKEESNKILCNKHPAIKLLSNTFGIPALCKKLEDLNKKIVKASQKDYHATCVFIMFETEVAQRYVLEKLSMPQIHVKNNNTQAISNRNHLFRGSVLLDVCESEEPSTIRWKELHSKPIDIMVKMLNQVIVIGMIAASTEFVRLCDGKSNTLSASAVAILNTLFPLIAKFISNYERHSREEHFQVWLYFKIAFFRWANTAVVITLITPFTSTTMADDGGTLPLVYKIFKAEIITSSVLQWLDPVATIQKHFVAPRATTQEKMNLQFRGTEVFLAERYTNLTKIFFLAIWYCPLYPAVLFFAAVALFVNYYLDAFSLMRTWKPQPKIGESISHYTRSYVFPITILVMSMVSSFTFGGFRFDFLCDTENAPSSDSFGTWQLSLLETNYFRNIDSTVTLSENSTYHVFCTRGKWNTHEQSEIVFSHDILSYLLIAAFGLATSIAIGFFIRRYFFNTYRPVGHDVGVPLRNVKSITGYIPQIPCAFSPYPFIACNVDDIKDTHSFMEWEDPQHTYEYYDLSRDAMALLEIEQNKQGSEEEVHLCDDKNPAFSRMVHWPYADNL